MVQNNSTIATIDEMADCRRVHEIKSQIKDLSEDLEPIETRIKNAMLNNSIDTWVDSDNQKVAQLRRVTSIRFDEKKWKQDHEGWENGEYAKLCESVSLIIKARRL